MVKCSFCGHENEDGEKYCEKCKTDLAVAAALAETSEPSSVDQIPMSFAIQSDTEVPTLHLEKIPKVEYLAKRADDSDPKGKAVGRPVAMPPLQPAGATLKRLPEPPLPLPETDISLKPRLVVIRGEKINMEYPVYPGKNYLGRTDDKPVDIDLESQEPPDRIWTSRQHAVITFENGALTIEDLNSLNGTFVNRTRVHPGQLRALQANDIIQVGTVQMRLFFS